MIPATLPERILFYFGAVLYFGCAALLFVQSLRSGADRRPRRALALILLMWGAAHVAFGLQGTAITAPACHPVSVPALLGGNVYVIISLLYPLELARPGWITSIRVAQLLLPFLVVTGIYLLVLGLSGESVRDLDSLASLLTHIGEFNVWYRIVLYLSICFYMVYMFMNTGVAALDADRLPGDPSPAPDRCRLLQLRIYGAVMLCISLAYLVTLLFSTPGSMFVHRTLSVLLFGVVSLFAARRPAGMPAKTVGQP